MKRFFHKISIAFSAIKIGYSFGEAWAFAEVVEQSIENKEYY
jgi:hypothetical protein